MIIFVVINLAYLAPTAPSGKALYKTIELHITKKKSVEKKQNIRIFELREKVQNKPKEKLNT